MVSAGRMLLVISHQNAFAANPSDARKDKNLQRGAQASMVVGDTIVGVAVVGPAGSVVHLESLAWSGQ